MASAADPGSWLLSQADDVPLEYFQGLTHDAAGDWVFAGVFEGLYRTDRQLRERARLPRALGADAVAAGFNHIGDPTFDPAGAGRLLLPLECYTPGAPNGGNTCGRGAIGIADPRTLAWRGLAGLDPADIPKAMWAEISPDGRTLWTSVARDLLVYRTADLVAGAMGVRPLRRLRGSVPPSGVTGAAFLRGRLYLAGQDAGPLQVWSVDTAGGAPRLEIQRSIAGESEGLDVLAARGGLLHWLVSPFAPSGAPPTYGSGHSELLTFVPRADGGLRVSARRVGRALLRVRVTLAVGGRVVPVEGATVRARGLRATTSASGVARLRLTLARGRGLRVFATKGELRRGATTLRRAR